MSNKMIDWPIFQSYKEHSGLSTEELENLVNTYFIPGMKACVDIFSKSNIPEDVEFAEDLKQLI